MVLLRLFLLLDVACAQLHRVLPRRRPGHLFKLDLAAPVGGIMRAALHRKRALAVGGCDHVVDAFQAVEAGAGSHARDGVEPSLVFGRAQLPALGRLDARRVGERVVSQVIFWWWPYD